MSHFKDHGMSEQTWLDQFYQQDYRGTGFIAINIGCNKGFDAVNLLRMGSNDGVDYSIQVERIDAAKHAT
jgi:hypothetical protein